MTESRVTTPKVWYPCPKCGKRKACLYGAPTGSQISVDDYRPTRLRCSNCGWEKAIEGGERDEPIS